MTIPVCQVSVTLLDIDGSTPIVGAYVSATPSGPIAYQGVVLPLTDSQVTNSTGQCTLSLVPSATGPSPVTYTFCVWPSNAAQGIYFRGITVPNVSSITLEELLGGTAGATTLTQWLDTLTWQDTLTWVEA